MPTLAEILDPGQGDGAPQSDWRLTPSQKRLISRLPYETVALRVLAWFLLAVAVGHQAFLFQASNGPDEVAIAGFRSAALFILSQGTLIFLLSRAANRVELGRGLRRLKAKVPTEDAVPAKIQISQSGTVTGGDEGYVWLHDGTLFFKGIQCVFRLNASDLADGSGFRSFEPQRPIRLELAGPREPLLSIKLIDPFEDFGTRRRASGFARSLAEWRDERPSGCLESILPPLRLHPSLRAARAIKAEAPITGAVLILINAWLAATARFSMPPTTTVDLVGVIQMAVALVLGFLSIRFLAARFRDHSTRSALSEESRAA